MDCDGPPSKQQPSSFTPGTRHSSIVSLISHGSGDTNQIPQAYFAIGRIHEICLRATSTYLSAIDMNRRARRSRSPLPTTPSAQLDDNENDNKICNTSSHTGTSSHRQRQSDTTNFQIPQPSSSLLKNTSVICNQLWMGSQRERLDVLNVEREAAKTMALLLEWAETVVLGDYDEWALAGEDAFWKVVHAGRHLCDWLGVQENIDAMNELRTQLNSDIGSTAGIEKSFS
ncbi:Tyrosine-protein phosphatase non-receptor type 9 [Apiospora arundinis]